MILVVFRMLFRLTPSGLSPESRVGRCGLRGSQYDAHLLTELLELQDCRCVF